MYFYIHGFASGKCSSSYYKLKEMFGNVTCLEYDSSKSFPENMEDLSRQVEKYSDGDSDVFIGTSMGGFYALKLGYKFKNSIVAFNPLVDKKDLAQFIGKHKNFCTGKEFELTKEVVDSFDFNFKFDYIQTCIYVSDKDEVLKNNVEKVKSKIKHCQLEVIHTPHRIDDFEFAKERIETIGNIVVM